MGIKVQFNPSTGKVSYNAITGKVQMFLSPCPGCANPPGEMDITISGLSVLCCDVFLQEQWFSNTWAEAMETLINDTHRLVLTPVQPTIDRCRWFLRVSLGAAPNSYSWHDHFGQICDDPIGEPQIFYATHLILEYTVFPDGLIRMSVWMDIDLQADAYIQRWECTESGENNDDCTPTCTLAETLDCDDWPLGGLDGKVIHPMAGGSVSVVAV